MKKKWCPLIDNGRSFCRKGECEWYLAFCGECAVVASALILADSPICQNIFVNHDEQEEQT